MGLRAQCSSNSSFIYNIHKDTIVAGDSAYFGINWTINDTSHSCMFNPILTDTTGHYNYISLMDTPYMALPYQKKYYDSGAQAEGFYNTSGIWTVIHDSVVKVSFIVPQWKAGWYKYENFNTTTYKVYIQSTVGIDEITGTNYKPIQSVRYYTMIGQLYGEYSQRQTNLPHIPLIEEVIYRDQSITTRNILHL